MNNDFNYLSVEKWENMNIFLRFASKIKSARTLADITMEPPFLKAPFCNSGLLIHWRIFNFKIYINNDSTDIIIPNPKFIFS